ncbi:hypothetical protein [Sedimentitalea nanhaiensis]|uniref:Uncharacterized protein n=1 Tax=Sedimentitalea nanhaiensis TaxID=999627 RepID=A0A1I6Y897_9RHOB|nr:hypothetical protein [Sedimentitalea nanhaiensis]SFT46364.1 hypothetical protein SAMN05216236_10290 [Sedimentitalea nanhaiensis]
MTVRIVIACAAALLTAGCEPERDVGFGEVGTAQSLRAAYALDFQGLAFVARETTASERGSTR